MPRGKKGNKQVHPKTKTSKGRALTINADLNDKVWSGGFKWSKNARDIPNPYNMGELGGPMVSQQENKVGTKGFVLHQREQLAVVYGSTTFKSEAYPIQPGDKNQFPWVAAIAVKYERYKFRSLKYSFVPLIGVFADDAKSGTVMLSVDYDAADSTPKSMQEVNDTDPHVSSLTYQQSVLRLDPKKLTPAAKFIRTELPPPGTDIKTYDAGILYVSRALMPLGSDDTQIGYITVEYEVEFFNPRLNGPARTVRNYTAFRADGPDSGFSTCTIGAPVGYTLTYTNVVFNGINVVVSGDNNFTLLPGLYKFEASLAIVGPTPANFIGGQLAIEKFVGGSWFPINLDTHRNAEADPVLIDNFRVGILHNVAETAQFQVTLIVFGPTAGIGVTSKYSNLCISAV